MASNELQFLDKIDANFLVCSICTERYKKAKCLPCLHSFCESCLSKTIGERDVVSCPVCRRTYSLPDDGVASIASNFFLDRLVEMFEKIDQKSDGVHLCAGCKISESVNHCIECAMQICETCSVAHRQFPATCKHRLVNMHEYLAAKSDDPASVQPPMYCTRHPEYKVEFYCDSCDTVICLKCTAIDHPRPHHKYRCIEDAANDYSRHLSDMLHNLTVKGIEAGESKLTVAKVSESLDKCIKTEKMKLKEHIHKTIEDFSRLVEESGRKLLTELEGEYDTRKMNLNAQMKELEGAESDLSHVKEYIEKLIQYGNTAQLMSAKRGISNQLEELLKVNMTLDLTEKDFMEFQPSDDFCKDKRLGTVLSSAVIYEVKDVPKFVRVDENITVTIATETSQDKIDPEKIEVEAVLTRPDGTMEMVEVTDNNDRTLTLKAKGNAEGEHELSVRVCRKAVKGSPINVPVIAKKGLLYKFGSPGNGLGQFNRVYGVTLTGNGNLLVSDSYNHRLQYFSQRGNTKSVIQFENIGKALCPFNAAVSVDGNIFITDKANKQVIVCDKNGKLIRCFGQGIFTCPLGIAISPINGRVYVVDLNRNCIHIYCQDGDHVKSFGHHDGLSNPSFVDIDDKGNVYISDTFNHRIMVFSADGNRLYSFGRQGMGNGQMNYPRGICLDKFGYVYVVDSGNYRILKFESDGRFICRVTGSRLDDPRGICVTDDEPFGKVIVADTGNNCVKVFAQ
ncbi:tripartite motif-containing protein 2-like [Glandiceps talaboti]